eukprot:XP_020405564.1 uncharacterized protein LOC100501495 isoform X4 [Zea mays]
MSTEDEKLLKEAKKLPWDERLQHKNWKVRNDANIDLAALCDSITDPKDARLREFGPLFKKTVADSNAPVQEKALDALLAFQRAADADASRYAKEVCDAIVAKCLTGRPKTVEKAQAAFLLWVELEAAEVFLESMEKAVKNKVAKAVVPAIDVMFQALSEFGTKVVPPKKILKMLPELFDHPDQNVRASSKGLTLELCRWIGKDPVKSILFEKMRDTMKKELEAELANVSGFAKPTRKIRSEQEKELEEEAVPETSGANTSEEAVADAPVEIDEYDLVDPVDILTPLEKSGFWDGVKATKWSERRDAVAELTKLASAKKIAPGDFHEICRTLKKLITDVNLAVSVEATQAIGNLARGLRAHFSGNARMLLSVLLEKLKEKKPTMTEALSQTLQAMHKSGCFTLIDVIEDVRVAVKNKVPLVRSSTLTWVAFCIETSNKATVLKLHKEYVPICMECLNDGTPEVRDASFSVLTAIAKMVGMKPLERSLEKLDDVRKKKLSDMIGSSSDTVLSSGTAPITTSGAATSARGVAIFFHMLFGSSSSFQVPSLMVLSVKTSDVSAFSFHHFVFSILACLSLRTHMEMEDHHQKLMLRDNTLLESVGYQQVNLSQKVHDFFSLQIPTTILKASIKNGTMLSKAYNVADSMSMKRSAASMLKSRSYFKNLRRNIYIENITILFVAAIGILKQEVESLTELDKSAELLIRLLCAVPGWSEKNVQVQQQVIEVITYVASTVNKFPKRCVVLCLLGVSERVADIKTRTYAMKCLTAFCEAVGPGFVFDRLYKIMKEHKNPKVLSDGILWMVSAVEDFGISNLKLKDMIDFCKDIGLQSSAAVTRNATIKLIGMLHKFVGPDIKGFLSDVKPALLSALDTEYEKNPFEGAAAAPKRTVRVLDTASSVSAGLSDGLPREDISSKITPTLLKNLGSPDWKVRLESIDTVTKIMEEANKRIQPTGTAELFSALRGRLYDSNKNLVMATLSTIGGLASAMGPSVEKSSKGILADVLKCLGDNKKHMRECTLTALDSWVAAAQLEKMVPYIIVSLGDQKTGSEGRKDLFDWLSKHVSKMGDSSEALPLLKPSASSLMDKSSEVRKAAESFMNEILRICGQEVVGRNLKDLPSPTLAIVSERLKLSTVHEGFSESVKVVSTSMSLPSKAGLKNNKHGPNDRGSNVGKPVSQRGLPQRASVTMVSTQDSSQSQALFNIKDSNKEERERRVLVRKFKFEEPRREQIDELKIDLFKHFREDVSLRLWNSDFKRQIDGIELLQKALLSSGKEAIELLDILLRWIVLRFCESNTTCLLKVLDFLPELFDILKDQSYMLTEAEAAIFLPCLIEKSGHNIEKVREKMGDLIKQMVNIYSLPKLLPYILEGLRSKNNRTRIECVDIIGYFIDHHGTEVGGLMKNLPFVAALTAERDGEIRKAALNTLATAYKSLGDDVWRYVGKLSDAQRSMLDDRFKWKAREMDKRREGRPGDARAALRRSVRENGSDIAEQSGEVVSRSVTGSMISRDLGYADAHMDRHMVPRQIPAATGPADWHEALDIVALGLPEQSVEGMKVICHELTQAADPESTVLEDLIKEADRLVSCLAVMVPKTFNFSLSGASSRSCKYVLNTLMQTFQIKRLAHAVKEGTLDNLITELLLWLLDERVPLMDDGSQLLKALNVLMLKILDNAERTSSFVVLINLLRPLDPSRWPSPTPMESLAVKNQKFSDLVVKCLIKLTKVLQSTIYEVDLDRILQSIHIYLQELGMEEIRRRAGADDKPLRMVKTVLHELVKLRGTAIKGHLSMVPIDAEPQPIILAYIDLNLQTLAAARMLTPSGPMGQTHWGDAASNNPNPSTHSADAQLKQELAAVFKKIGDKQTCTIGFYELYRITQLYPKVDIFAQLQNASEAFRTYIRDGLAQVEKNAAAGRTPSSLPLSTPPPIAAIPSPKLAPSPVHTKSIGSKTDYNEDNASGETQPFRGQGDATDQQTDRYQTSGTLDALRERMKSIQAAAIGHFDGAQARPLASMNGSNMLHGGTRLDGEPQQQSNIPPMDERALSGLQARMERLKSGSMESL